MKVRCKRDSGTNKLIKGEVYNAIALFNSSYHSDDIFINGLTQRRRRISIEGVNTYYVDRFETLSGDNLYGVSLFENWDKTDTITKDENLTGQYVKCTTDKKNRQLKSGQIYLVKEHKNYNLTLEGVINPVSSWSFRKISISQQRKIKLNSLSGVITETGISKRKFLYYTEIEKLQIILELFKKAVTAISNIENKNEISIVDLMVKYGSIDHIKREDILPLFDKSLSEISKNFGVKI